VGRRRAALEEFDPRPFEDLVTRIEASLPGKSGRVIAFIASGSGEGTSTLTRAYVATAASQLQRNVLLLTTDEDPEAGSEIVDALINNRPLDDLLTPLESGGWIAELGFGQSNASFWELLTRGALWSELRTRFDEVVLDLPDTSTSRVGLGIAAQCDGVVIVLEAEKSRAPVVSNLVSSLTAVQAHILGCVMNKRRFYVPWRIYDIL
jgi:protein-tyrosine kinase